ncbi:MAG: iron-containing alcohol dehydrogenase [Sandaracinaceae bacterium]|nr:iron-containing alcohol dehydrogenase [Sandaracinaceae bacterium]
MTSFTGNWNYPTSVRFGAGRVNELGAACAELGIRAPLVVTDPGLRALPLFADVMEIAREAGLRAAAFSEIQGNPVEKNVTDGVLAYREAECDGVIAFGGGSALDVAKAVALMVGQARPLWDFEDVGDNWTRVDTAGMAPVVAVPTTAGTGSEVGRCSVVTDEAAHKKRLIFHPKMLPERVICDPALTAGLPPALTAWVGMDALSHNLEAYLAPAFHPLADGIAIEGMRLVARSLIPAVRDGRDLEARASMMAASLMGATAFQKGLGAMHALSHPVSVAVGSHHGLTNAIVMPYVMAWNEEVIAEKCDVLARALSLAEPGFRGVQAWILGLREAIGIPHTLADVGVTAAMAPELAPDAAADPTAPTNPQPVAVDGFRTLYERAVSGAVGG